MTGAKQKTHHEGREDAAKLLTKSKLKQIKEDIKSIFRPFFLSSLSPEEQLHIIYIHMYMYT